MGSAIADQGPDSKAQLTRAGKGISAHQRNDVVGLPDKKAGGKRRMGNTPFKEQTETRKHQCRKLKRPYWKVLPHARYAKPARPVTRPIPYAPYAGDTIA